MTTNNSNIMTNFINYLAEGYRGLFLTAGTGSTSVILGIFKVENIDYTVSCMQLIALFLTIIIGVITLYSKLKKKKDV